MSLIESKWRARQTRCEDGIFYPSDEFAELCGAPDEGYRVDLRASLSVLLRSVPDGWTQLEENCSAQAGDFAVFAGSTVREGAGFIAVERRSTGRLLWLLHLAHSKPFVQISFDGSTIQAVAAEYPFRSEWQIPIEAPESVSVSQVHDR